MNLTAWQRLEKVINWTGLSIHAFAMTIGLKRSENIYRIKRGSNGISRTLAMNIISVFPDVNIDWLLGRSDEMFYVNKESISSPSIPVYPTDKICNQEFINTEPLYKINIPIFNDCKLATFVTGNAMTPIIPQGATIILKQCNVEDIVPGKCYLIVTNEFSCVRYIRLIPEKSELVNLVPENKKDFDELQIPKDHINQLFMIQGVISSLVL